MSTVDADFVEPVGCDLACVYQGGGKCCLYRNRQPEAPKTPAVAPQCFSKLHAPTREGRTVFLVLHNGHHKDGWDEERQVSVDAADVLFIEALAGKIPDALPFMPPVLT